MVKDCEQLRQFREFLARQGRDSEVQLLFWLALEDLRETSPNSRACQRKMERIIRNFINNKETKKCALKKTPISRKNSLNKIFPLPSSSAMSGDYGGVRVWPQSQ